nr:thiamine pyrophosphate-binding protein [Oceanobacillus limi]
MQQTKTMTAAHAIVECMKREKVTNVFCVPGESYLPLLDALYDEPSIRLISARHEGGASFIAEGYAKASLKPGVVLATRGVGATNLSIGVHTAYQDSTPMVVFLGQVHRKFRGREGFQEIDLEKFFQPISKWAVEVTDPERMPELVQQAFRVAQSGRPGPVIVSLPEDVLPVEGEMSFKPVTERPKPAPSQTEIEQIEQILTSAKSPLIIAGGGVKLSQGEDLLLRFAERFTIPTIAAFRRHDIFPNNHPLYAGHLGLGTNKQIIERVKETDVILALGTRLSEVTTQDYTLFEADQRLVHIDIDHQIIGKVYAPDIGVVADLQQAFELLLQINIKPSWSTWAGLCRTSYIQTSELTINEGDVINKHIIQKLNDQLPKHALLTNDAGNFAGWLHSFYSFDEKHTYVGPTSGAMGYGMPAALGAKLAYPSKTVVSLSGDGGFMMTFQELETAVRESIPIIAIVFNNNMYGTIRMHQEMHYPNRVMGTDLGDVSFADLATSIGAIGKRVLDIEQFESALDLALQEEKPTVIEVLTDKEHISVSSTITQLRNR